METIITVLALILLGILALTVFGMTITKKDMDDFEYLSAFVEKCDKTEENYDACMKEWHRLYEGGHIPADNLVEVRKTIIKKFK